MEICLYQPEIPQNFGTIVRLCACMNIKLNVIEPCGFLFSDKKLKRSAMDYMQIAEIKRHLSWESFMQNKKGRIILFTTKCNLDFTDFKFEQNDILLFGQETAGVPHNVAANADFSVKIPHKSGRSLNLAISVAMAVGRVMPV